MFFISIILFLVILVLVLANRNHLIKKNPLLDPEEPYSEVPQNDFSVITQQNGRDYQEDTFVLFSFGPDGLAKDYSENDKTLAHSAWVFDGHGGKEVSARLMKELPPLIANIFASKPDYAPRDKLVREFGRLDAREFGKYDTVGSTATGVVYYWLPDGDFRMITINLGDSQTLFVNDYSGDAQITSRHNPTRPSEALRIRRSGFSVERGRVGGNLAVSRAFGDMYYKKEVDEENGGVRRILADGAVSSQPEIKTYFGRFRGHIILGSDGIWDYVDYTEIIKRARNFDSNAAALAEIVNNLAETGAADTIMDNSTVIVVQIV